MSGYSPRTKVYYFLKIYWHLAWLKYPSRGLHYEHITLINDATKVICDWCHNLEHHSRVINYDPRCIIYTHLWCLQYRHHLWWSSIDDHNMCIVQATGSQCRYHSGITLVSSSQGRGFESRRFSWHKVGKWCKERKEYNSSYCQTDRALGFKVKFECRSLDEGTFLKVGNLTYLGFSRPPVL